MSSLSARERRILIEIEKDLAAAEPHLERALASAKVPAFQYWPVVRAGHPKLRRWAYAVAIVASLLCGIGLLATGIALDNFPLIFCGIPLAQFGPFAIGRLGRKTSRSTR